MIPVKLNVIDKPHHIYRCYDADDRLLYVGISIRPEQRIRAHKQKPWWPLMVRSEISEAMDYLSAFHAEQQAILHEKPLHNVRVSKATLEQEHFSYQMGLHFARKEREEAKSA